MDQQKFNDLPDDNGWFDNLLDKPNIGEEIGPDEQAISSAGLAHLDDMELEKILAEAKSSDWGTLGKEISEPAVEVPQRELQPAADEAPVTEFKDDNYRDIFGEGEELDKLFSPVEVPAPEEYSDISENSEEEEYPEEFIDQEAYDAAADDGPVRKGRPRRKKGYGLLGIPHILSTLLWLVMILSIGVSLGRFIWVCAADVLAFGREQQKITITIDADDTVADVADKLEYAGLIKYSDLFELFGNIMGAEVGPDARIHPGTYELDTLYDYNALIRHMRQASTRDTKELTIPEGYTCAQIFAFLEENGICTVAELEEYCASGDLGDYWFLEGVEQGDRYCLEGFLFPDTYEFYVDGSAAHVIGKLLDNFEIKFSDLLLSKLDILNEQLAWMLRANGYGEDYIEANKMTVRDIVIVASMVEKESTGGLERYDVASVIYNRLTNQREFPYLQIDATVVYALGGKSDLTTEDLAIDHPYNTYVYSGLIPGPISNPGLASLDAALEPNVTNYHYYAYDPAAGSHHFSETYQEHLDFLASLREAQ